MIRIPPPTLLLPQLPKILRESLPHALKVGQILQARVLSENLAGQVKLSIGESELTARTSMQVAAGQRLTLQVVKTGPLPELQPLSQSNPQQLQNEALKRMLPRQRPLSELFEKLPQLQSLASYRSPQNPIKQTVQRLVEDLLRVEHPRFRQNIKAALLDSGLFTERNLINREPRDNDLKLNLLRLYDLIKTLLPPSGLTSDRRGTEGLEQDSSAFRSPTNGKQLTDLFKRLEGAIARVQTHQLASLPKDDPSAQVWQFELPLLHRDQVDLHQITIKQEDCASCTDPDPIWTLTLQMNLQPLGPMRAKLRLQGKALGTFIWAERRDTLQLLERHLPELQQALSHADLEVTRLQACQAKIPAPELASPVTDLLSEKA